MSTEAPWEWRKVEDLKEGDRMEIESRERRVVVAVSRIEHKPRSVWLRLVPVADDLHGHINLRPRKGSEVGVLL